MHTREQAAGLWCPMVRGSRHEVTSQTTPIGGGNWHVHIEQHHVVGGCNTDALGGTRVPASCRCVADQCAMWRWVDRAISQREPATWWPNDEYPLEEPPRTKDVPASAVWVPLTGEGEDADGGYWTEDQAAIDAENAEENKERRGYCGLAGSPAA